MLRDIKSVGSDCGYNWSGSAIRVRVRVRVIIMLSTHDLIRLGLRLLLERKCAAYH